MHSIARPRNWARINSKACLVSGVCSLSPRERWNRCLEGWGFVAFGDDRIVESSFGGVGCGGVVRAGAAAFRHLQPAPGGSCHGGWVAGPQGGGGCTQLREQVQAGG